MLSAGVVAWQEACAGSRRIENRSGTIKVEGKSEQDGKRERERERFVGAASQQIGSP